MRATLLLVFVGAVLMSCKTQVVREKRYLDWDSLVNVQVAYLTKSKSSLIKKATIDGKMDSSVSVLDSIKWSNELDVFRQLDLINRPIYKDAYTVKDGIKDSQSNLLVRWYEAAADAPVPYLKLYYQEKPSRLKKIEAVFQENNSLYGSQRKLEMHFDDATGKPYLTGYTIEGNQKMMLSDSVHYTIRSEVASNHLQ